MFWPSASINTNGGKSYEILQFPMFPAGHRKFWPQHGAVSFSDGIVGNNGSSSFHVEWPADFKQRCTCYTAEQSCHCHQPGPVGHPRKTPDKGICCGIESELMMRTILFANHSFWLPPFYFCFSWVFLFVRLFWGFFSSQESSGIEVFWRPLSNKASALVFFSRRTDMPYRYQTSLKALNYTTGSYKVSAVFVHLTACVTYT